MKSQKIFLSIVFRNTKFALGFIFFYLNILFFFPEIIGRVQFAISFITVFSFIFNLGFDIAHLKIYPEEIDKAACIGGVLLFKGFFILISLIIYFLLLSFIPFDKILLVILIIFIFDQIIEGISTSLSNILVADGEVIKGTFSWVLISIFKILFLILGYYISPMNEITLALVYIISSSLSTITLVIYILPYKIKKPTWFLLKKYFLYTYPLSISHTITIISSNIGIILINYWISSEAVAFYYAGDHLAVIRTVIPNMISLIMISIFSKNIKESNLEKNKQLIKQVSEYFCILWSGIILLSFLYSDELIILLFGKTYQPSIFVFNILILSQIIVINDIAVYTDINARGKTKLYSFIKTSTEFYNIFLMFIFLAPFGLNLGINGLAISIIFTYLTYSPIIRLYLWKKYKYSYNFKVLLYLSASFIVYVLNLIYTARFNLLQQFYLIPVFMLIDITIFLGLLYIFRCLNKRDLKYFKQFLNIKSLIRLLIEDLAFKNNLNNKNTE